jgi:hypothetical protein
VLVVTDDPSVEAVLEEVAASVVPLVKALRVAEVEEVHAPREVVELAAHDQMKVGGHLARGEEMPVPLLLGETLERREP